MGDASAMTPAEQSLLLAVFRWARAEVGVVYGKASTWTAQDGSWGVCSWPEDWEAGDPAAVEVWRAELSHNSMLWVTSIAEAVDGLVALGILPHRFSTSYRAGWEAHLQADNIIDQGIDGDGAYSPFDDESVRVLLPAATPVLAVRP